MSRWQEEPVADLERKLKAVERMENVAHLVIGLELAY